MTAPKAIHQLVEHFEQNRDALRSGKYNEAQLRQEFLNPFFAALGWDMFNEQGFGEAYKEVIHETSVEVEGSAKAPDYAFRIGGMTKFFVEAKKPSVNIEHAIHPAYQVKRYAWSAKLPLAILSDFEEFAVYDCRSKPNPTDQSATGRVMYLNYRDYIEKWDEIANIFSKDAIQKGAFDQYAQGVKGKRGTKEVDDAFLEDMEKWRELLAKNLALRNPELENVRSLNYAVQMTIDRIVFLRICEDRGIEKEGQLKQLLNETPVYEHLCELFKEADKRYNSGLFHFDTEKGQSSHPDELTLNLIIDDKALKEIINGLYFPSPYVFKLIPTEILGQVYERFLGKVIRLTAGHQAKVEEKPEVRKAGGVYYTPTYIVNYIVKNTVGKLLEGKTPKEAAELKIVDPACGSGSFLLGAYQTLLNWHTSYYNDNEPEKHAKGSSPAIYRAQGGEWKLTTDAKKHILLNNLHGVDIDAQAVEVTKLSLLLKVLEGESQESMGKQLSLLKERALPDLGRNIQCGNSLIGTDYYADRQMSMDFMDEEERQRVNAFDWKTAFPQVFARGGFDAVIGNPPYIFTRNEGINQFQKTYFYTHYKHQSVQLNTFGIFLEKCCEILNIGGRLGFITPNNWLTIDSFFKLRKFILEFTRDLSIINILDQVFEAANVDTAMTIFEKGINSELTIAEMKNEKIINQWKINLSKINPPSYIIQISLLKDNKSKSIIEKIENYSKPLYEFSTVSTGLKAYQIGKGKPAQSNIEKSGRVFHATSRINNTYGRYLQGVDVCRYYLSWSGEYLSYGDWLAEPRKSVPFIGERILVRQIPSKPPYLINGGYTSEPFYNDINSMVIFSPQKDISLFYLLGSINSRLISFWFMKVFDKLQRNIFPQFKVKELASFPIHSINLKNPSDIAKYNQIVFLANQILTLHKQTSRTPQEKESLQREIEATDRQIDQLVYELYGLTEEEIKIVEGG